jgi:hypothetical protein
MNHIEIHYANDLIKKLTDKSDKKTLIFNTIFLEKIVPNILKKFSAHKDSQNARYNLNYFFV